MSKPIIAVDLDNVLAASAQSFVDFSNKHFDGTISLKDYHEDWKQMWGVDDDEVQRRAEIIREAEIQKDYLPISGAKEALIKLSKKYELRIITSRRKVVERITKDWINKYYPNLFTEIIFAGFWDDLTIRDGHLKDKAHLYMKIKAEFIIDDQLKHCIAAADTGIEALLYGDYPWNQAHQLPGNMTRYADWSAVAEFFNAK